jgi:hypothetical protein
MDSSDNESYITDMKGMDVEALVFRRGGRRRGRGAEIGNKLGPITISKTGYQVPICVSTLTAGLI